MTSTNPSEHVTVRRSDLEAAVYQTFDRDQRVATCLACGSLWKTPHKPNCWLHLALTAPAERAPDAVPDVRAFAMAILHGDEEHQAWLIEAANRWIEGKDMPPPRSKQSPSPTPDDGSLLTYEEKQKIQLDWLASNGGYHNIPATEWLMREQDRKTRQHRDKQWEQAILKWRDNPHAGSDDFVLKDIKQHLANGGK